MGICPPAVSASNVLDTVMEAAGAEGITTVDKCLVYAADAIGEKVFHKYRSSFETVLKHAAVMVPLRAVFPPKTPVCYASMFTGAVPEIHGIRKPEKPVLACDTIFDAFIRAGRRVAILAVAGCSIDRIFRNRNIDYFTEHDHAQAIDRTIGLLESDKHDLIVAYHGGYDDRLHKTTPYCPEAIQVMHDVIDSFERVAHAVEAHWKQYDRMIVFAPDHGAHVSQTTGRGTHGEDIPDDMHIQHFFGLRGRHQR